MKKLKTKKTALPKNWKMTAMYHIQSEEGVWEIAKDTDGYIEQPKWHAMFGDWVCVMQLMDSTPAYRKQLGGIKNYERCAYLLNAGVLV
jgi:hypothetical protein